MEICIYISIYIYISLYLFIILINTKNTRMLEINAFIYIL